MRIRMIPVKIAFAVMVSAVATIPADAKEKEQSTMPSSETSGTNRAFSYEVTTTATAEQVWALWTDVSTWKAWDKGLRDAELAGPMQRGSKGKIISSSGSTAVFEVTEFDPKRFYTFVTALPLAKLTIRRTIVGASPTRFRHEVSFSGASAVVFANTLGPGFRKALPPTMREIAAIAEGRSAQLP